MLSATTTGLRDATASECADHEDDGIDDVRQHHALRGAADRLAVHDDEVVLVPRLGDQVLQLHGVQKLVRRGLRALDEQMVERRAPVLLHLLLPVLAAL